MLRAELVGRHVRFCEERVVDDERTIPQVGLDVLLQAFCELLVAFRRDHGQQVHVQEVRVVKQIAVLTHALAVHAQAQATAYFLSFADSLSECFNVQIWNTLGLSQPSRRAEWLKMNLVAHRSSTAVPCSSESDHTR